MERPTFHETILRQYTEDAAEKEEALEEARKAGDEEDYEIMVHGLKSTSRMIGAVALSGMAKALEEDAAARRGVDPGKHAAMIEEYHKVVRAINDTFSWGVPGEAKAAKKS